MSDDLHTVCMFVTVSVKRERGGQREQEESSEDEEKEQSQA